MNKELSSVENDIFSLLKGVIDPELMVNIVDLGLVYDVSVEEKNNSVIINMTLTSPGCPMGDAIQTDVKEIVISNYKDYNVNINLVWSPPWNQEMISDKGREALGH